MALFIGSKTIPGVPAPVVTCFQELERWANAQTLIPFSYAAGWADNPSDVQGGFIIDPFGWVHLLGAPMYTGSLATGTATLIASIPQPAQPSANLRMMIAGYDGATSLAYNGQIQVQANGLYWRNASGATLTNGTVPVNGYSYLTNSQAG